MGVVCDHAIPVEANEFMKEFFQELEEYEKMIPLIEDGDGKRKEKERIYAGEEKKEVSSMEQSKENNKPTTAIPAH